MEEKEKGYLELSPDERDYRLLVADKLLTGISSETRIEIFKNAFLKAARDYNDEAAYGLLGVIGEEYSFKEKKIAEETNKHYGDAVQRANLGFGDYLRNVYWELPDKEQINANCSNYLDRRYRSTLLRIKAYILRICVGQWASYYDGRICFEEVNEKSRKIFSFLVNAYNGLEGLEFRRYVSKEEQDEILKLFREKTNSFFTPEIAEKWLSLPNVPEEIRKIFRISWIRNGGQELFDRCMKNAEIVRKQNK